MIMGFFWMLPFFTSLAATAIIAFQVLRLPFLGPESLPMTAVAIGMSVVPYVLVRCLQCADTDKRHRELLAALKAAAAGKGAA